MKKTLLIIFLLLTQVSITLSQVKLSGKIIGEDGSTLAFCKVGVEKTSIGTLSDKDGLFMLEIPQEHIDKNVKFSSIGYEDLVLKIIDIPPTKDTVFTLHEKEYEIESIVITPKEEFKKGKKRIKTASSTIFSNPKAKNKNLGSEIGKLFKIKKSVVLEHVNFFVKFNDYEKVKLRLNIYSVENKLPAQNILSDEVFISFGKTNGDWKSIDLSDYEIVLTDNVIITLEWIYGTEGGKYFGLPIIVPSVGSTHFYRFGSQGKWKKYNNISIPMEIEGHYTD